MESVGKACIFVNVNKNEEREKRKNIEVQCLVVCVSKEFSWIGVTENDIVWVSGGTKSEIYFIYWEQIYSRVAWHKLLEDKMECVNEFKRKENSIRQKPSEGWNVRQTK